MLSFQSSVEKKSLDEQISKLRIQEKLGNILFTY